MDGEHHLLGRTVGVVHEEGPVQAAWSSRDKILAMAASAAPGNVRANSRRGRRSLGRGLRLRRTRCGRHREASPRRDRGSATRWPRTPCAAIASSRSEVSSTGSRKSLNRRHSENCLKRARGGRLVALAASPTRTSATRRDGIPASIRHAAENPTRSPPRVRSSVSASASTTARLSLVVFDSRERKRMEAERSTQSHTVCAASHSRSRTKRWSELAERRQSMPARESL